MIQNINDGKHNELLLKFTQKEVIQRIKTEYNPREADTIIAEAIIAETIIAFP